MKIEFERLNAWYKENLGKIVLLLIFVVVLTLSLSYIPYLNILILPPLNSGLAIIVWYILFFPSNRVILLLSLGVLFISMVFSLLKIHFLAESIADVLYLFLIFILINYTRGYLSGKN